MLRAAVVVATLLLASTASAQEQTPNGWRTSNWALEGTFAALVLVDVSQTLDFTQRHQRRRLGDHPALNDGHEWNPILGPHPDRMTVYLGGAAAISGHFLASLVLPRPYREWWQCLSIGVEAGVVGLNWTAGIGFSY